MLWSDIVKGTAKDNEGLKSPGDMEIETNQGSLGSAIKDMLDNPGI